mmetsp:Transcript_57599/g.122187  ORF Transcript_57599/g.122187 Transcript_57599/m.122187 type:complete len:827 (+) Transcript_57599:420-2900(+)
MNKKTKKSLQQSGSFSYARSGFPSGSVSPAGSVSLAASCTSKKMAGKSGRRRSISKTLQAPLKSVLSRVRRGKKPSKSKQPPSRDPSYTRCDSVESSTQGASRGSFGVNCTAGKATATDSHDKLDVSYSQRAKDADHFVSLETEKQIDTSTNLSPLEFDEDHAINHFQGSDSNPSKCASASLLTALSQEDDFSLYGALTANDSSESDDGFRDFLKLNGIGMGGSAFEQPRKSPPPMPELKDRDDCSGLNDSDHSIPSLSGTAEVPDNAGGMSIAEVPQEVINKDEAADSALAWGCLTAVLVSPAPRSVLPKGKSNKSRTPVNLWQESDDYASLEDLDDVRIFRGVLHRADGSLSIPSICSEEGDVDVCDHLGITEMSVPRTINVDEAADSTMAWSSTAYLGAPVPQFVHSGGNKQKKRMSVNLGRASEEEDFDDIVPLPSEGKGLVDEPKAFHPEVDLLDNCSILSLAPGEAHDDDDIIPSVKCVNNSACAPAGDESDSHSIPSIDSNDVEEGNLCFNDIIDTKVADREAADSAIAWGALGMILGLPAPQSVSKMKSKISRVAVKNCWVDIGTIGDDGLDIIPSIDLPEDGVDFTPSSQAEDSQDEISLPDVDESPNVLDYSQTHHGATNKEVADSTVAWSALAALLGTPAPPFVVGKKSKPNKGMVINLWDDCNGIVEDLDDLSLSQNDSIGEEGDEADEDRNHKDDQNGLSVTEQSFELGVSEDNDDTHSMPSLSGTFNDEEGSSSPLTLGGSPNASFDGLANSLKRVSSDKDLADSVLVWGALAACLGSPAPKAALSSKRKKEARDLWGTESDGNAADLTLIL